MRSFAAFVFLALNTPSWVLAQSSINIAFDPAAQAFLQSELGLTPAELNQLVDDEIRALYGLVDVPTFLRLSANAQSMANKGLGVDYATNLDGLIFGVAVSAAADAGDADVADFRALADGNTDRAVPVGAGAQIAVMAGYTVADRWSVFMNGLYYPLQVDDLDGTFYNFGIHGQYKAVLPAGERSTAQWGGLDITLGFQLSRMFLELSEQFEASGTLSDGFDLDTISLGRLELEQRAFTMPLEITTNATFFYFLTLYGGVGLDLQLGDASMDFDLDSELRTDDPLGGRLNLGTAEIRVDDVADPDAVMFRFMGGVQLNIWRLKLFGQVNFLTSDLTVSLAAGLRLVI
ncbi:MAG: hypothetical protein AAF449_19930 [Myxococcota bacterium]